MYIQDKRNDRIFFKLTTKAAFGTMLEKAIVLQK